MSGSIGLASGVNYAALFAPLSIATTPGDSVATLAEQLASGTSTAGSTDPLFALQTAERNQSADVAAQAKQPQVQRTIAQFTAAVQQATSPQQLLQNQNVLTVLLTANGLGSQASYTALAQQALLSDPNDPKSLVSQLGATNTAWTTTAQTFQFATKGLSVIKNPQTIATLAQGYAEILWRQSLDQTTPGLSNAIDFHNRASGITSVDQILGDATFRTVVTGALGIPPQIAYQDLGAQEQAISSRIDVKRFSDPKFVEDLTQQYLLQTQAAASGSSSTTSIESLAVQAQGLLV